MVKPTKKSMLEPDDRCYSLIGEEEVNTKIFNGKQSINLKKGSIINPSLNAKDEFLILELIDKGVIPSYEHAKSLTVQQLTHAFKLPRIDKVYKLSRNKSKSVVKFYERRRKDNA